MTTSDNAFGDVTVAISPDHVAEVEMHRPPANYFDAVLLAGVVDAIRWAADARARAVVLCSEGKHFCAGMDLAMPSRLNGWKAARSMTGI